MNMKKFSDAMSELDMKYIDEALNYKKKTKKLSWIPWGATAACLCLIAAGALTFSRLIDRNTPDLLPVEEIACGFIMKESDVRYFPISFSQRKDFGIIDENATGLTDENIYEITSDDLGDIMGTVGESQDESMIGKTVYHFIRFPSDDSICIVEVSGTYQFYVKDGTEGIEESDHSDRVTDVAADENPYYKEDGDGYSRNITLEYVTELQDKISAAMSNGELSFVSSSAVYENPYRLHIVVSSNAESDLSKLKAFDTIGGALEIEYHVKDIVTE